MSGGASADFLLSGGAAIARIVWLLCDHCGRNKTLETPPRVGSLAIEEKLPLLAVRSRSPGDTLNGCY